MTKTRLAIAVLVDREGRALIQLRSPGRPYGNHWGLVGGHIEPDESPVDAARREIWEETGLRVGDLWPLSHDVIGDIERFVYWARIDGVPTLGEGEALEFVSSVDDRPFAPPDATVLGNFLSARRRPDLVVTVPLWQGSGSAHALRLAEGAALLAPLVPARRRVTVDVPAHMGTPSEGVRNRDVLTGVARRTWSLPGEGVAVTVGGDCGADLAPIAAAVRQWGDDLTVLWFDAHADVNTPVSSPSGAFHGMVLRALLGEGARGLVPPRPLRPDRVVLLGTRALDPAEEEFIESAGVVVVAPKDVCAESVVAAVRTPKVYVHIDLDVLDPEVFGAVGFPEPGGLSVEQLADAVAPVVRGGRLAGMGIMEFMPRSPADAGLARVVADALFQSGQW